MPRPLGNTSLQILAAIRGRPTYGLDIVASTGLPSGTVYPTLGRLKRGGLVTSRWEDQRLADREGRPRRRYYELTGAGMQALSQGASRLSSLVAELDPQPTGRSG